MKVQLPFSLLSLDNKQHFIIYNVSVGGLGWLWSFRRPSVFYSLPSFAVTHCFFSKWIKVYIFIHKVWKKSVKYFLSYIANRNKCLKLFFSLLSFRRCINFGALCLYVHDQGIFNNKNNKNKNGKTTVRLCPEQPETNDTNVLAQTRNGDRSTAFPIWSPVNVSTCPPGSILVPVLHLPRSVANLGTVFSLW